MSEKSRMSVLLAAGGTGGHVMPALRVAQEGRAEGHRVVLVTDARGQGFVGEKTEGEVNVVRASGLASRHPGAVISMLYANAVGLWQSLRLMRRIRPQVVIGFGGYPSLPPVVAAILLRIPVVLHEQNARLGRANRVLRPFVRATGRVAPPLAGPKDHLVGLPLRDAVIEAASLPHPKTNRHGPFRILLFGGSQGANLLDTVVPEALSRLSEPMRARLDLVHQARPDNEAAVVEAYRAAGIAATVAPFFDDLPKQIARAHLVIARAGASTVAEISLIGRMAIFFPLKTSGGHDQAENIADLCARGGAIKLEGDAQTSERLLPCLAEVIEEPSLSLSYASKARATGIADASQRLLALALRVGKGSSNGEVV